MGSGAIYRGTSHAQKSGSGMKLTKCIFMLFICLLFSSCTTQSNLFHINMELTQNYDKSEPFIDERLFVVTKDTASLQLTIDIQSLADTSLLEIIDTNTKDILWYREWDQQITATTISVSLSNLVSQKEYLIRFSGTGVKSTNISITSDDSNIQTKQRPSR